jgi:transposase
MKNNPRIISKSRRNAKISLSVPHPFMQKRKKLIFFVIKKSYSIGKAASRLKVKLSTAKMIVKRYKIDGTFFEPKFEQTRRLKSQSERRETSSDNDFKREEELPVKVEE